MTTEAQQLEAVNGSAKWCGVPALHNQQHGGAALAGSPKRPMLLRAIFAFVCLPGTIAFIVPLALGLGWGNSVRYPLAGTVLVGVGTLLLLACVREFYVAGRGTLAPWSPPRHLVITGPYRYSRNPMYVAVLMMLAGWATLWSSSDLAIYAAVVLVGFVLRVRLNEEPWAERTFGEQWQAYRSRVPRWLGLSG
jgi:protein-S-isoprenylcysteine O-methyltransferase Ste14